MRRVGSAPYAFCAIMSRVSFAYTGTKSRARVWVAIKRKVLRCNGHRCAVAGNVGQMAQLRQRP